MASLETLANEGSSSPFKDQQECQTQILKTDTSPICFDAFNDDDDNDRASLHDDDNDTDDDDYEGNFFQEHNLYQFFFFLTLFWGEKKQGMTKTENRDSCSDFKDKQKYWTL